MWLGKTDYAQHDPIGLTGPQHKQEDPNAARHIYMYSETCVREPPSRLTLNSG